MEETNQEYVEVVIKDFNFPAVNGNMYDMSTENTQKAIQKFIQRQQMFGELNHPTSQQEPIALTDPCVNSEETNNFLKRILEIDLSNAAVDMTELRYDEEKKQIIGKIKPVLNLYPNLLEDLNLNKVAFGMRSLCHQYKKEGDGTVFLDIAEIITFDVINTAKPENT